MLALDYLDSARPEAEEIVAGFARDEDRLAASRYRSPLRRRQSVAAYALLRATLQKVAGRPGAGWRFSHDPAGKPMARSDDATGFAVSLSHSRSLVACAISDLGPLGIDVEYCAPERPLVGIASTAFGRDERRAVDIGGAAAFYRIWTLREALAKANGAGLPMVRNKRDYFAGSQAGSPWRAAIDGRDWLFAHAMLPGAYAMGLAVFGDHDPSSLIVR
ncbi:MAG: 4'-phosphopantetheinyl transferase family protein [Roseiarcus sp.]